MSGLFAALAAATPTPSPSDVAVTDSTAGSPGFIGFVVTFLLAVAAVGLFLSLTKQLRVVDRRARQLGLDGDAPADEPHQDRGVIDAGAAGPDLEVDADVAVAPRLVLEDPEAGPANSPERGPGTPDDGGRR